MDKSDFKLETAAGSIKSTEGSNTTTEHSLNNKNDSEVFDDTMIYYDEDWIDYEYNDINETTVEPRPAFTPEFPPIPQTVKKPPKNNKPCSEIQTSEAPKCKKRKLPSFEELLESLDYNILYLNFTKLLQFLESNSIDMCFPFTLQEYEDFFKMLVRNISLLKSKSLDAHYRDICDKIADASNFKKTGFLLTYIYECRQGYQNIVLVIKKVYVMQKPEEKTSSSSSLSVMPSSQTSSDMDTNNTTSRSPSPGTISSGFKIHTLRTALAFVNNEVTNTKEFPELSTEQAHFMQLLLDSVVAFADLDSNLETKELFRALWEAVRIHSLKYEFRVKCVDTFGDKKNLVFEKIPKTKPVEMAINLGHPALNSHQINQMMNPSTGAPKSEAAKPEAPKPEASKPEPLKTVVSIPRMSKPNTPDPVFLKPEIPKQVQQMPKKVRKKLKKLNNELFYINHMPSQLISDTLHSIIAFLSDPLSTNLVFVPKTQCEQDFYRRLIDWCRCHDVNNHRTEFRGLQLQILKLLERTKFKILKSKHCNVNEETGIKEVTYEKPRRVYCPPRVSNDAPSTPKKKKVNLQNVLKMAATTDNIKLSSVVDLNQSLRHKKKNKKAKIDKIKYNLRSASTGISAWQIKSWSDDSSRESSSERGSSWDRSKPPARPEQLTKKTSDDIIHNLHARQMAEAEMWQPRHISGKEILREGLSIPVQSDKAMRMMRGMGWSGGALGARGNGITEPLMPALDVPRGAGLGHISHLLNNIRHSNTLPKKLRRTTAGPSFIAEKSKIDIIVQKTNQLLLHNPTFDSVMKMIELTEPSNSNIELSKPTTSNVELPKSTTSHLERPEPTISNVELPKSTTSNYELPKSTTSDYELPKSTTSNYERPKPTISNYERPEPTTSKYERPEPTTSKYELPKSTTSDYELPKSTKSNVELPKPTSNVERPEPTTSNIELPKLTTSNAELPKSATWNIELSKSTSNVDGPEPTTSNVERPEPTSNYERPNSTTSKYELPKSTTSNTELPEPTTTNIERPNSTTSHIERPEPTTSNVERPEPTTSNTERPEPTTSNTERPEPTTTNVERPESTISNVDLPKSKTSNVERSVKTSNIVLPTLSSIFKPPEIPQRAIQKLQKLSKFLNYAEAQPFRLKIFNSVLELLNSNETCKTLFYVHSIRKREKMFVIYAMVALRGKFNNRGIFRPEELEVCNQISEIYKKEPDVLVKAFVSEDSKQIHFKKITLTAPVRQKPSMATTKVSPRMRVITKRNLEAYILSFGTPCVSVKAFTLIKFRVLFLLNVLNFAKSSDEEIDMSFNKCLSQRHRMFIEMAVEEVNMRIKCGASPVEQELSHKINVHMKSAFLGVMFNHQYTAVTLNKFYDFKKSDSTKRKWQTSINIVDYSSETHLIEDADDDVNIDLTETESDSDDSIVTDDESIDGSDDGFKEHNLPILPPGEEGVNLSHLLYLYETKHTAEITNTQNMDSVSKNDSHTTGNRNNKNNIGIANVLIDDNDNQMIDVKKENNTQDAEVIMTELQNIGDTETVEYIMCLDYAEEVIKNEEHVQDSDNNDHNFKNTDLVVAQNDHVETVNQAKDNNVHIENDDIDEMIDKVILNTKNPVVEDSGSKNDGIENTKRREIKNISENQPYPKLNVKDVMEETEHVILNEIDIIEPKDKELMDVSDVNEKSIESMDAANKGESMEVTNAGELIEVTNKCELMEVTNKDESMKVTDKGESMEVTNAGELIEVTNKRELMEVTNKDELMKVTDKGESMEVTNAGELIEVTNKRELMEVTNKDESMKVTDKGESMEVTNAGELIEVTNKRELMEVTKKDESMEATDNGNSMGATYKGESMGATNKRESTEVTNTGESMEVTSKGESMEVTNKGESMEVTNAGELIEVTNNFETMEATDKGESMKVTDKGESMEVTNAGELIEVTNKRELMEVTNKDESMKVTDKGESMEVTNTGESMGATNKGESMEATDKGESMEVTNKGESMEVTNKGDLMEVTNTGESVEVTNKGESMEITNRGESMEVTNKGESMEVTNIGESMEATNSGESMEATNSGKSMEVTNKGESIEATDKNELMEVTNTGESMEVTNNCQLMEVTDKGASSKDVIIAQMEEEHSINPSDNQTKRKDNLEVKTDCDIVSKRQLDVSQDICDTQSEGTEIVHSTVKNIGSEIKNVSITHSNPAKKLTVGKLKEIQLKISKDIQMTRTTELPLLMCHGFQNGRLAYTCYSRKSYNWLKSKMNEIKKIKFLDTTITKMALTFYCFMDFDSKYMFKMIELYNRDLSTKDWVVEKKEEHDDHVVFIIKMDTFSIDFIQASELTLFAGVDKVEFSPIWE